LERYTKSPEVPHCPTLKTETQQDAGIAWSWSYDRLNIGYGYNAWFLGLYPYAKEECAGITSYAWFKEGKIKNPSFSLLFGDASPKSDRKYGGQLWWPFITGDGSSESVNVRRHDKGGNVIFNDGHAEFRRAGTINPPGVWTNQFRQYWDPMQRLLK
jgi:prepilin-type processing-associated H-X9-DG protein